MGREHTHWSREHTHWRCVCHTHMKESFPLCDTAYTWFMSHIDDSYPTWMRRVIRISMSHFTQITHRVISHVSCHTHGWVTSYVTHMNKPCLTFTHHITHLDKFRITWRMWISLMLSNHPQASTWSLIHRRHVDVYDMTHVDTFACARARLCMCVFVPACMRDKERRCGGGGATGTKRGVKGAQEGLGWGAGDTYLNWMTSSR